MYWLNLDWIVANWVPLTVSLLLGFVLGWLLTGLPASRRAAAAQSKAADLEAKARKAERDLADLKKTSDPLAAKLALAQTDLEASQARIGELEAEVTVANEKVAALEVQAEEAADDAELVAALEESALDDLAQPELVDEEYESRFTGIAALGPDVTLAFAALARSPEPTPSMSSTEIALNEAYARVVTLQRDLEERDRIMMLRQAETEALQTELMTSNAARHELEGRLVRAREDVASELAVLASTMIKMKDDALARSDARVASLAAEVDALRAEISRNTSTAG